MKTFKEFLTPLSVLVFTVVAFIDHRIRRPVPAPSPVPAVTGQVLGRTYAPLLLCGLQRCLAGCGPDPRGG